MRLCGSVFQVAGSGSGLRSTVFCWLETESDAKLLINTYALHYCFLLPDLVAISQSMYKTKAGYQRNPKHLENIVQIISKILWFRPKCLSKLFYMLDYEPRLRVVTW